jgi:hypothetical protein
MLMAVIVTVSVCMRMCVNWGRRHHCVCQTYARVNLTALFVVGVLEVVILVVILRGVHVLLVVVVIVKVVIFPPAGRGYRGRWGSVCGCSAFA